MPNGIFYNSKEHCCARACGRPVVPKVQGGDFAFPAANGHTVSRIKTVAPPDIPQERDVRATVGCNVVQAKAQEPVPGQDAAEKAAQPQETSENMEFSTAAVESQVISAAATEEVELHHPTLFLSSAWPSVSANAVCWASGIDVVCLSRTDASQATGGKTATKSQLGGGFPAESLAVDRNTQKSPEGAPPPPASDKAAKHGGKGDATDDKSEKEAERADAKEKEKKKKYKVNEELLQAFRYFDRNCKCTCPFQLLLSGILSARSCC